MEVKCLILGLLAGVLGSYLRSRFSYWRYSRRLDKAARKLDMEE